MDGQAGERNSPISTEGNVLQEVKELPGGDFLTSAWRSHRFSCVVESQAAIVTISINAARLHGPLGMT